MHYTPIEQRIIDLLSDGLPHERNDVLEHVGMRDTEYTLHNLAVSIMRLRPKIRAMGQEIVTEHRRNGIAYRHVILLSGRDPCGDDPLG